MERKLFGNADLVICALLAFGAFLLFRGYDMKSSEGAAIATLVGAMFGGAALLLGNWINRWNERQIARKDLGARVLKLKALIAAELVNVAAGHIGAKNTMAAAVTQVALLKERGGSLPHHEDLTRDVPRPMPFTDNLGSELLILEQRDIDILATLRSNLTITKMNMDEVTAGRQLFGYLTAQQLLNGIRHNLEILSEAFERFAPERKLELPGKDPVLATELLRELSKEREGGVPVAPMPWPS